MYQDGSNAKLPEARINLGIGTYDPVKDHDAPTDGTTDAAAAINASLQDCKAAKGGKVILPPRQYAVIGVDLTIPAGCSLEMASPPRMQGFDGIRYGAGSPGMVGLDITQPAIRLDAAKTIQNHGMVRSLAIFKRGLTYPTSIQDTLAQTTAFSGTAIVNASDDTQIEDAFIIGFNTCVSTNNFQRPYIRHIRLHCKNGLYFNDIHDVGHITDVHGWAYYPGNDPNGYAGDFKQVTGVANNGSGAIRLTLNNATGVVTGNTAGVRNVAGMQGANGDWPVTVIDGTHVDLQGSTFAGVTKPGTWNLGETFVQIALADMNGIWMGQTVTAAGIAGGTTVRALDAQKPGIWLSKPTTASGAGVSLTFGNGTFSGTGGSLFVDPNLAAMETFISVTNSDQMNFSDIFVFGWKKGVYLGVNSIWAIFHNFSCDNHMAHAPHRVCMYWDDSARLSSWIGGEAGGNAIALVDKASGGVNAVVGVDIREPVEVNGTYMTVSLQGAAEAMLSGLYSSCTNCSAMPSNIAIYQGAGRKHIGGMLPNSDVYPQNFNVALGATLVAPGTTLAWDSPFNDIRIGWAPTLYIGGAPSAGTVYVAQQAVARRHWPWIESDMTMVLSTKGGGSGGVAVGGFPNACNSYPSGTGVSVAVVDNAVGLTGTPLFEQVNGSAIINLRQTAAAGLGYVTDANLANNSQIRGQFKCVLNWVQR